MKIKSKKIFIIIVILVVNINFVTAQKASNNALKEIQTASEYDFSNDYGIQWEMNFGSDPGYGARYEGPQPIGDCDNDGKNELLIGGRDSCLRVFEWDETKQTYLEMQTLHTPYYPVVTMDADGFAIGDLTGDGKNEIAVSWYAAIHHWENGKYKILGFSTWLEDNGGGSPDCLIGDYDNDGKNEIILSCRYWTSSVPEIVTFEWDGKNVVKESEWDDPGVDGAVFMAGIGDVDYDLENEIVCGASGKVVVLDWDKQNNKFESTVIKQTYGWENYPFACICKDSDMDGKNEIHVGYYSPEITIFEYNGTGYEIKYEKKWPGEGAVIEGLDVGDVDQDGINEVCAGTDVIHILQWNGETYVEEAVLPTFGDLAVLNIGDCDNDGKNEIHAGSVNIYPGQDFMSWVYKYGLKPAYNQQTIASDATGSLYVKTKTSTVGTLISDASVAAWNLETKTWYNIQPDNLKSGAYTRDKLPAGEYLLRATGENYKIQEVTISIVEGQQTSYTFSLEPITKASNKPLYNTINWLLLQFIQKIFTKFHMDF